MFPDINFIKSFKRTLLFSSLPESKKDLLRKINRQRAKKGVKHGEKEKYRENLISKQEKPKLEKNKINILIICLLTFNKSIRIGYLCLKC